MTKRRHKPIRIRHKKPRVRVLKPVTVMRRQRKEIDELSVTLGKQLDFLRSIYLVCKRRGRKLPAWLKPTFDKLYASYRPLSEVIAELSRQVFSNDDPWKQFDTGTPLLDLIENKSKSKIKRK